MMFEDMMHMGGEDGDPIGILLAASMVRDDMPWFYEIARDVYQSLKTGDVETAEREIQRLNRVAKMFIHGPFMEEFGNKEMHMMMMEFPHIIEHTSRRFIEAKKRNKRGKNTGKEGA